MSILIKGMEMPTNEHLIVKINPNGSVNTTWKNDYKKYEAVPAADVVPVVHAYWIWLGYNWRCSACKRQSPMAANYCPFCGAKMDEEESK